MFLRLLFLVCVIYASLFSLSQESGKASPDVPRVPSDAAVVSKARIVYVVGDVRKPVGLPMKNNDHITVLQALALAEGTNPTAALRKATIIRKGEDGHTEIPVDIQKILQGDAADVTLQADDILFVPRSGSKSAMKKENYHDVPSSIPLQDTTPILTPILR
jgi:polysaccharide biosynthesis/export protein